MTPKKPIQRAIEVLIRHRITGQELTGTVYANDFSDAETVHHLEGHLADAQGGAVKFVGQLSGVQFVPVETRGAPKKVDRDVALFLAYQWFLGNAKRETEAKARNVARQGVMELWATNGFKGVTEETHLTKRVKAGAQAVHGLSLMHYVCTGVNPDGVMIAAHEDAFDWRPGEYVGINGHGWYWRYGMEAAIEGGFTAVATLTNH